MPTWMALPCNPSGISTGEDEGSDVATATTDIEQVVGLDADDNGDTVDVDGDLGIGLSLCNASC